MEITLTVSTELTEGGGFVLSLTVMVCPCILLSVFIEIQPTNGKEERNGS